MPRFLNRHKWTEEIRLEIESGWVIRVRTTELRGDKNQKVSSLFKLLCSSKR